MWKGAGVIALLCIVNALRRNTNGAVYESRLAWLHDTGILLGTGIVLALTITVAVVATYNRTLAEKRYQYPAVVVAVLFSSGIGTAMILALEARLMPVQNGSSIIVWMTTAPRYALLGLLFAFVYVYFKRAEQSATAAREVERDR